MPWEHTSVFAMVHCSSYDPALIWIYVIILFIVWYYLPTIFKEGIQYVQLPLCTSGVSNLLLCICMWCTATYWNRVETGSSRKLQWFNIKNYRLSELKVEVASLVRVKLCLFYYHNGHFSNFEGRQARMDQNCVYSCCIVTYSTKGQLNRTR